MRPTWTSEECVLTVSHLTRNINSEHLREIFSQYGEVRDVTLAIDKPSGLPKGYAHVELFSREQAEEAQRCLNAGQLDGDVMKIEFLLLPRGDYQTDRWTKSGAAPPSSYNGRRSFRFSDSRNFHAYPFDRNKFDHRINSSRLGRSRYSFGRGNVGDSYRDMRAPREHMPGAYRDRSRGRSLDKYHRTEHSRFGRSPLRGPSNAGRFSATSHHHHQQHISPHGYGSKHQAHRNRSSRSLSSPLSRADSPSSKTSKKSLTSPRRLKQSSPAGRGNSQSYREGYRRRIGRISPDRLDSRGAQRKDQSSTRRKSPAKPVRSYSPYYKGRRSPPPYRTSPHGSPTYRRRSFDAPRESDRALVSGARDVYATQSSHNKDSTAFTPRHTSQSPTKNVRRARQPLTRGPSPRMRDMRRRGSDRFEYTGRGPRGGRSPTLSRSRSPRATRYGSVAARCRGTSGERDTSRGRLIGGGHLERRDSNSQRHYRASAIGRSKSVTSRQSSRRSVNRGHSVRRSRSPRSFRSRSASSSSSKSSASSSPLELTKPSDSPPRGASGPTATHSVEKDISGHSANRGRSSVASRNSNRSTTRGRSRQSSASSVCSS